MEICENMGNKDKYIFCIITVFKCVHGAVCYEKEIKISKKKNFWQRATR
jgi:hypothetical protein